MRRAVVVAVLFTTGCTTLLGVDFDSAFPEPDDGGPAEGGASGGGGSGPAVDGSSTCDGTCSPGNDGSVEAGPCAESPCKATLPQCGCPTGQACYLSSTGPKCGAPGIVDESDECTTNADCIP